MSTPRLGFTEMADGEGSGYDTFNKLTQALDALLNIEAQSATVTAPPGGESEGQLWYVPAAATGAWAGHDKELAQYWQSAWTFYTLPAGTLLFIVDTVSRRYVDLNGDLQPA